MLMCMVTGTLPPPLNNASIMMRQDVATAKATQQCKLAKLVRETTRLRSVAVS